MNSLVALSMDLDGINHALRTCSSFPWGAHREWLIEGRELHLIKFSKSTFQGTVLQFNVLIANTGSNRRDGSLNKEFTER